MTDLNEKELKPCPFCGKAMMLRGALWPSEGDRDAIIHAEATDCPLYDFSNETFDGSIVEVWNRRALTTPPDASAIRGARLPKLSDELYEFYPSMSAQTHEEAVKAYALAALAGAKP